MSLYYRLKRLLGHDTKTEIVHYEERYRYTITHLDGEKTVVEGNCHTKENAFLNIWEKDDNTWAILTFYPDSYTGPPLHRWKRAYDVVGEFGGVKDFRKEYIGTDKWTFIVDKADRSVVDQKSERIL